MFAVLARFVAFAAVFKVRTNTRASPRAAEKVHLLPDRTDESGAGAREHARCANGAEPGCPPSGSKAAGPQDSLVVERRPKLAAIAFSSRGLRHSETFHRRTQLPINNAVGSAGPTLLLAPSLI